MKGENNIKMKGVFKLAIRFAKGGRVIIHPKGMTNDEAIQFLEKRIKKREKELFKRKWIFDEYNSLLAKQNLDIQWVDILRRNEVILGE